MKDPTIPSKPNTPLDDMTFDDQANADAAFFEKLADAQIPGYQAEFDPDEAERAGAFVEDAMSEQDALESQIDLIDSGVPTGVEEG